MFASGLHSDYYSLHSTLTPPALIRNAEFSGADRREDGRAGEGDHGKSLQEDEQVPRAPGL